MIVVDVMIASTLDVVQPNSAALELSRGYIQAVSMIDFALEARKLRTRGIIISKRSGEFAVNVLNAKADTEQVCETLNEVLALAKIMAQSVSAQEAVRAVGCRAPRRRRMTPKAHNKRLRRAQWRRLVARARREQEDN